MNRAIRRIPLQDQTAASLRIFRIVLDHNGGRNPGDEVANLYIVRCQLLGSVERDSYFVACHQRLDAVEGVGHERCRDQPRRILLQENDPGQVSSKMPARRLVEAFVSENTHRGLRRRAPVARRPRTPRCDLGRLSRRAPRRRACFLERLDGGRRGGLPGEAGWAAHSRRRADGPGARRRVPAPGCRTRTRAGAAVRTLGPGGRARHVVPTAAVRAQRQVRPGHSRARAGRCGRCGDRGIAVLPPKKCQIVRETSETNCARPLGVGERLGAVELLAHVVGDGRVEVGFLVGEPIRHGVGEAAAYRRTFSNRSLTMRRIGSETSATWTPSRKRPSKRSPSSRARKS